MIVHFRSLQLVASLLLAGGLATPAVASAADGKTAPVTIALMGKDFTILGDWVVQNEFHHSVLYASPQGVKYPPVAAVVIPRAGKYRVWVAAKDFPNDRPGTRTFCVAIAGKRLETVFGKSGKDNYEVEDGGWVELPAGPAMVTLEKARPLCPVPGIDPHERSPFLARPADHRLHACETTSASVAPVVGNRAGPAED